jgi:hypothetical protein
MKRFSKKISKEATSKLIERIFIIMSNCPAIGHYPEPDE